MRVTAWNLQLTPATGVGLQVDEELGFAQARAIRQGSRGVGDALEPGLGDDELLDALLQRSVVLVDEPVDNILEDKSSISSPGIKV